MFRCHSEADASEAPAELDVRRSSHKKVAVFLRHFARLKLFSLKDQAGVISVINVQRAHDLFRGAKVEDREEFVLRVTAKKSADGPEEGEGGSSEFSQNMLRQQAAAKSGSGDNKVVVLELFKLTKQLRDVFGSGLRGAHGEYFTAQEVTCSLDRLLTALILFEQMRELLVAHIKEHSLESPSDKASVVIPPLTALHSLVPDKKPEKLAAAEDQKPSSSSGRGFADMVGGDDDGELCRPSARASDPWATGSAPHKLSIHKDGLIALDDSFPLPAATLLPPPTDRPRSIAGSSSVGGWGVDRGVAWKAVSLPSAPPAAVGRPKSVQGGHVGNGSNAVRAKKIPGLAPLLPAADHKQQTGFLAHVSADVLLRKEELFKLVLSKASPYSGIMGPDGRLAVHSGQVRRALVLLETRMGNKAVTILRNLEVFGVDLAALVKDCQKRYVGCFCFTALAEVLLLLTGLRAACLSRGCRASPRRKRWCCRATSASRWRGTCPPRGACRAT